MIEFVQNVGIVPDVNSALLGDPQLLSTFWRYERALMDDDVAALATLFAADQSVIRSDGSGPLVGAEHIAGFRSSRGGVPARTIDALHLRRISDKAAVLVAEATREDGQRGVQTQVWQRMACQWRIVAAHVALNPGRNRIGDDESVARSAIWRVPPSSEPLVTGALDGPLRGQRVAVKDLFAVAGQRIGAGNPRWLQESLIEPTSAEAVQLLVDAGADVVGIAQTDELAFSLAGTNQHYGTPPNPAAPGRICGGSTSGPAAAVALGDADIGLGTDTAGSIRVPASYCGLYGIRTTHDAVSRGGLVGLAPSFDTVGILTRDPHTLATALDAIVDLPGAAASEEPRELLVCDELLDLAEPDVQTAVMATLRAIAVRTGLPVARARIPARDLETWFDAFRTTQHYEAWAEHGRFVAEHGDSLEPAVAERFRQGSQISDVQVADARAVLAEARDRLTAVLSPGRVLALPTTSSPAPARDASADLIDRARAATLRLTCLASLAGLPQLSVPGAQAGRVPVGLGLIGAPGSDRDLVSLLTRSHQADGVEDA